MVLGATPGPTGVRVDQVAPPHAQYLTPPESSQSLRPIFAGLTLSLMVTRASTHSGGMGSTPGRLRR
jgi:hypothetical protein